MALVPLPIPGDHVINRHLLRLNKTTGDLLSTKPVLLEPDECSEYCSKNELGTLKTSQRLGNGVYGTTYKVTIEELDKHQLIVQLQFHSNVVSMNALQDYIRTRAPPGLPLPRTFPTPSFDRGDGLQLQVTEFVPGTMGDSVFKRLSIEDRVLIVRHMARAFAALWELPVSRENNAIGEAVVSLAGKTDGSLTITVGPEKQDGVGGPFDSVSSFLKA